MSKRSKSVRLTILGAVALTAMACEEAPRETPIFSDLPSCVASGVTEASCHDALALAEQEHRDNAPAFRSQAECEAWSEGSCSPAATLSEGPNAGLASSMFVPAMAGFALARAMEGGRQQGTPVYNGPPPQCEGQPPQGMQQCRASARAGSASSFFYYFGGSSAHDRQASYVGSSSSRLGEGGHSGSARSVTVSAPSASVARASVSRGGLGTGGRATASAGG